MPLSRSRQAIIERQIGDRSMTYINAFRCNSGIVMSADSQQTVGDYKDYVEKIAILEDRSFPIAVGGAGVEDIILPFSQDIIERVSNSHPRTKKDLVEAIKATIKEVFEKDVPFLALKRQHRAPQFLIAAKPKDEDFCIFPVIGRRVYPEKKKLIIGYASPYNNTLLNRMYRENLTMQQAVMLALYLVSQSKKFDEGVGGENTHVAVVTENGASIDDPVYISNSETRVQEFLKMADDLFLTSIDISMRPSVFVAKLEEFAKQIIELRNKYAQFTAAHTLYRTFNDPNYHGDPYAKYFPGAVLTLMGNMSVQIREETPEEIARRQQIFAKSEEQAEEYRKAAEEFDRLVDGRKPVYIDTEAKIWLGRRPATS